MSTDPPPGINPNMVHLWQMLLENGHSIKVVSNKWTIDGKLNFRPDMGTATPVGGGKSKSLRGGAKTIFEHLHGMLIAA